jgi:hypothetical protein
MIINEIVEAKIGDGGYEHLRHVDILRLAADLG